jgi:hypothetical protein
VRNSITNTVHILNNTLRQFLTGTTTTLTVKHDTLHVFFESRQRPDSNIPKCSGTASTLLRATGTTCHRTTVRGIWLHVKSSSEGRQMCIICRRHCKQPKRSVCNFRTYNKCDPSLNIAWQIGNVVRIWDLPIDTERVHLAYLKKSCLTGQLSYVTRYIFNKKEPRKQQLTCSQERIRTCKIWFSGVSVQLPSWKKWEAPCKLNRIYSFSCIQI